MTERVVIFTGYNCNNNCRFCCAGHKRDLGNQSTSEIKKCMDEARENGAEYVDFIGGEATIRRDIFKLVAYAKEIGYETIKTTTNGRMYSNKEFSKKIVDAGLNGCIFSIHGHNSELHDDLTRVPGSFEQAIKGIKNLQELGVYVETNTVISKPNYKFLPEIQQFFVEIKVDNSEYVFLDPDPSGYAYTYFDEMVVKYSDMEPYLHKALDIAIKNNVKHAVTQYVPLCFMKGYEKHIGELFFEPEHIEHRAPEFVDLNVVKHRQEVARVKGPQCDDCKYVNICEGIWKQYAKKVGVGELVPIKGKIIESKQELHGVLGG